MYGRADILWSKIQVPLLLLILCASFFVVCGDEETGVEDTSLSRQRATALWTSLKTHISG
jgi:hypothetical protein